MTSKVLIVDDEANVRRALSTTLRKMGYELLEAGSGVEALEQVERFCPQVMLLDLRMPQLDGMDTLRRLNERKGRLPRVVMMTAYGSASDVMEAMKLGAFDYVQKPFDLGQVKQVVAHALTQGELLEQGEVGKVLQEEQANPNRTSLIGLSPAMQNVYKLVGKVAMSKATVLIEGESGTGKELIARAIHSNSPRADKPLIPVNCGAIPENLLESELFGYERGAFTGAVHRKQGLLELANGGTLFLDEVGELSLSLQVKLLRFLQDRVFIRVGGIEAISVDVRVIAATNRDLQERIRQELFREDLYYRLNVVPIRMPPLRERKEDIPLLIRHFLAKYGKEAGKHDLCLSAAATEALIAYHWPGNVRQLENTIERAVVLTRGAVIGHEHVLSPIQDNKMSEQPPGHGKISYEGRTMREIIAQVEQEAIAHALRQERGNKLQTAKRLGISRRALLYKLQMYGLDSAIGERD
ncbi:sigma-54-dependent Fis family transcriptional regulator [Brevibacillus sp. HB1.3]|uniref:sigma-54-dependent transcriptional regulator n=1 Tax=Brevibacillus sp. HB1.3 TaxID=2738842 RepID=UPI0015518A73|nr:sigma-54 dependent transcriptional regulator [Brevibacillus sp. HB1.3]NQF16791.1 sigma-54-dependent Fis family transcriptional regulator [Brevibacillus sp. HB1.3]